MNNKYKINRRVGNRKIDIEKIEERIRYAKLLNYRIIRFDEKEKERILKKYY